jgi:hypothetical protein
MTSARLLALGPPVTLLRSGFASIARFWQAPILSIRWVHLPLRVPPLLMTNGCGAGISDLLAIAYDYDVLGLGPDSPWVD